MVYSQCSHVYLIVFKNCLFVTYYTTMLHYNTTLQCYTTIIHAVNEGGRMRKDETSEQKCSKTSDFKGTYNNFKWDDDDDERKRHDGCLRRYTNTKCCTHTHDQECPMYYHQTFFCVILLFRSLYVNRDSHHKDDTLKVTEIMVLNVVP